MLKNALQKLFFYIIKIYFDCKYKYIAQAIY